VFNEHLCPVFRALADPRRIWYVEGLADGDVRLCDFAEIFALTQPTVIHHLKVLADCGLLESRKDGRMRLYTLRPEGLRQAYNWMHRIVWQADPAPSGAGSLRHLLKPARS
jgi:ArsR family transcriptional regulator